MRNILFVILIVLTELLTAQNRLIKPEMYVGLNYGKVGSMVTFSPTVSQTYILGNTGGLVFRYIAEKNVGVQVELNYSQRGWKEADDLFEKQLNYIELPFLTHIYIGRKSQFFINLGPKIGFLVSEKIVFPASNSSTSHQQINQIDNPFEYGVCAGLGYLVKINKNVLHLEARTGYSISDIYSNQKKDYFSSSRNLNVAINASWLLQIK